MLNRISLMPIRLLRRILRLNCLSLTQQLYTDAVRGHHLTAMKALRQKHGLDEEQTIVEQGLPEDIIPATAEKLNAAMVILGTTGRTGLSAVFIGNTAEHVIDKINCDVLALKPNGYISPLDPNTAT